MLCPLGVHALLCAGLGKVSQLPQRHAPAVDSSRLARQVGTRLLLQENMVLVWCHVAGMILLQGRRPILVGHVSSGVHFIQHTIKVADRKDLLRKNRQTRVHGLKLKCLLQAYGKVPEQQMRTACPDVAMYVIAQVH